MNMCVVQTETDVHQIPVEDIRLLVIATTRAVITTYAVVELLRRQVGILFTDDKAFPIGEVNNYLGTGNRNKNIQQQIDWPIERKQNLWAEIVKSKILNQSKCLECFSDNDQSLEQLIVQVSQNDSSNREAVAARMYFTRLFGSSFVRHNDDEPINALLNYGYSILLSTVAREISLNGFLTELGIHHNSQENVFNLACDLMEPFRPIIDRAVAKMTEFDLSLQHKIELIELFDDEVTYLEHQATVNSAITEYVRNALDYLCGKRPEIAVSVEI